MFLTVAESSGGWEVSGFGLQPLLSRFLTAVSLTIEWVLEGVHYHTLRKKRHISFSNQSAMLSLSDCFALMLTRILRSQCLPFVYTHCQVINYLALRTVVLWGFASPLKQVKVRVLRCYNCCSSVTLCNKSYQLHNNQGGIFSQKFLNKTVKNWKHKTIQHIAHLSYNTLSCRFKCIILIRVSFYISLHLKWLKSFFGKKSCEIRRLILTYVQSAPCWDKMGQSMIVSEILGYFFKTPFVSWLRDNHLTHAGMFGKQISSVYHLLNNFDNLHKILRNFVSFAGESSHVKLVILQQSTVDRDTENHAR